MRASLLLEQPRDLERLLATTIRQVWIDTGRGADIAPDITPAEVCEAPDDEAAPSSPARLTRTSVELQQARQIIGQARDVLKTMFRDVRLGRPLDLPASGQLVDEMAESIKRNPML